MPDSDYSKIAELLGALMGGNTVMNTASAFMQPPAAWGDREGAIAQAVPMAGAAFTGGMPMATRGAAGMAGGRLGAQDAAPSYLSELKGAGNNPESFKPIIERMRTDKSLKNSDLMSIAQEYGYGGIPFKKTRDGIIDHIFSNWVSAVQFENKLKATNPVESVSDWKMK